EGVVEAAVSPFKEQPVRLLLNGTLIFDGVISQQMILHCTFDPSLVGDDGVATLSFELPRAKQHDELMPHDPRHLALAIEWFTIRESRHRARRPECNGLLSTSTTRWWIAMCLPRPCYGWLCGVPGSCWSFCLADAGAWRD